MSSLIRIFTFCLVNLFFIPIFETLNKQGHCPNLAVCPNIPDFTLVQSACPDHGGVSATYCLIEMVHIPTPYVLVEKYKNNNVQLLHTLIWRPAHLIFVSHWLVQCLEPDITQSYQWVGIIFGIGSGKNSLKLLLSRSPLLLCYVKIANQWPSIWVILI